MENVLKKSNFEFIACVSGWVDIFASEVMKLNTLDKRKEAMYRKLAPIFPDKKWFMEKIILIPDTDNRCKYIDLNSDWYYVDDWADKFFTDVHGEVFYKKEKDNRILLCDHRSDGEDVLNWLIGLMIKNSTISIPMRKIIFLDFDGVLQIDNHSNPWKGNANLIEGYSDRDEYGLLFDYECVERLQQLIEATDAEVVISSSWRHLGLTTMMDMWMERQMPGELIDIIPMYDQQSTGRQNSMSRGECIEEWLKENKCECYVILDDVNDFLKEQFEYFVETDYYLGFQDEDLEKAIGILSS